MPMQPSEVSPRGPWAAAFAALAAVLWGLADAQALPDPAFPVVRPAFVGFVCEAGDPPVARTEAERARFEMRARYREFLPAFFARVGDLPDAFLLMPIDGLRVAQVADTWGAPRGGGRRHEGQDLFAVHGTPVRSATPGFVGASGNAAGTPPHLHLGVYDGSDENPCAWVAIDPLPLLLDRP